MEREKELTLVTLVGSIGNLVLLVFKFVASILVGAMLFRVSWNLLKASTSELTDSSLPEEVEKEIEDIICSQEQIHEPQYPVTIHMEPKK